MRTPEEIAKEVENTAWAFYQGRTVDDFVGLERYIEELIRSRDASHAATIRLLARELGERRADAGDDSGESCEVRAARAASDAAGLDLDELSKEA